MTKVQNITRSTKGILVTNGKVRRTVPIGAGQTVTLDKGFELFDDHPVMQSWLDDDLIKVVTEEEENGTEEGGEEGTEKTSRRGRRRAS